MECLQGPVRDLPRTRCCRNREHVRRQRGRGGWICRSRSEGRAKNGIYLATFRSRGPRERSIPSWETACSSFTTLICRKESDSRSEASSSERAIGFSLEQYASKALESPFSEWVCRRVPSEPRRRRGTRFRLEESGRQISPRDPLSCREASNSFNECSSTEIS